ncbi:MAG: metal-dependent hydrolase [Streptosporangiales bacterium]|nr:metal-dependent hydrolase [Streptosporangiales bacterium]
MRVVTFNIHHGVGLDGVLDLGRVADVLASHEVDVACLQEVDEHFSARSAWEDQAGLLAGLLGMEVAFGANLDLDPERPGEPVRRYGNAIVSRHPLDEVAHVTLPRADTDEPRGLLSARVRLGGTSVRCHVTHLEQSSARERLRQAAAVADAVGAQAGSAIITGDLNAVAGADELAAFRERFVDAWDAAGGSGAGHTFRTDRPDRRIDYVWHTSDLVTRHAEVLASPASDHLPLLVDIAVPGENGAD